MSGKGRGRGSPGLRATIVEKRFSRDPSAKNARRYVEAVERRMEGATCCEGHLGCALRGFGPCSDFAASIFLAEDPDDN